MNLYIATHIPSQQQAIMNAVDKHGVIISLREFRPSWDIDDLIIHEYPEGTVVFRSA